MASKILVTGSSGFVGSHIMESDWEHQLVPFDVEHNPEEDVLDPVALRCYLQKHKPDVIIHLATNTSIVDSRKHPFFDLQLNATGTLNLVWTLNELKLDPYLIFTSSAQVYGEPQYFPVDEKHPIFPRSPYGLTNFLAEGYIRLFCDNYTILRLFNVYGPRQLLGNVIPDFIHRALNTPAGTDFTIYGSPQDTRDFIYIDDVIRLLKCLIDKPAKRYTFNVGYGVETFINDVASIIFKLLNKSFHLRYIPRFECKVSRMLSNNYKVWNVTGWEPKINITNGLKRCVQQSEIFPRTG